MIEQNMVISLVGTIVSSVIAVLISYRINREKEIADMKKALASDLFGYKYQLLSEDKGNEINIALNKVPIVFCDDSEVIQAYDELFKAIELAKTVGNNKSADEALVSFYKAVCTAVGIKCEGWNDSRFTRVLSRR